MIVVADASPLRYLILIEHTHVLPLLYGHVYVPSAVITELTQEQTPVLVQEWIANPPDWVHVQDPTGAVVTVAGLHAGELAAIALAEELAAAALLMDERDGRREAERRGLPVLGTLRVVADAAEHGLADLHHCSTSAKTTVDRMIRKVSESPSMKSLWNATTKGSLKPMRPSNFDTSRLSGPEMALFTAMLSSADAKDWIGPDRRLDGSVQGKHAERIRERLEFPGHARSS